MSTDDETELWRLRHSGAIDATDFPPEIDRLPIGDRVRAARRHAVATRWQRDDAFCRIVEGATEVMAAFIALVGMKGVGEEFESILRATRHPIGNFGRLAKFAQSQWETKTRQMLDLVSIGIMWRIPHKHIEIPLVEPVKPCVHARLFR